MAKEDERAAVHCKHNAEHKVRVDKVRRLFAVMQLTDMPHGYLVSSGDFTQDAHAEAPRCGIVLLQGADTLALVNEAIAAGVVVPRLLPDPASAATVQPQPSTPPTDGPQRSELPQPPAPEAPSLTRLLRGLFTP